MARGDEIIRTEQHWILNWTGGGTHLPAADKEELPNAALRLISSALRLIASLRKTVVRLLMHTLLRASDVSFDFAS